MRILFIVGEAGVGKDTAADYLAEKNGWNIIHSYTNRPMRKGETQGKEHIFVNHRAPDTTFAYTHYGDYDYWTELSQFTDKAVNIYVIDEKGLIDVREKFKKVGNVQMTCMYISSNIDKRKERGVSCERMERDATRVKYDGQYDFHIMNNGSIDNFYRLLDNIVA